MGGKKGSRLACPVSLVHCMSGESGGEPSSMSCLLGALHEWGISIFCELQRKRRSTYLAVFKKKKGFSLPPLFSFEGQPVMGPGAAEM